MSTRIYAVDRVSLTLEKTNPPNLVIMAAGRALTPLWSAPALSARSSDAPPVDGVLDFDFTAAPPERGTITAQVLTGIAASAVLPATDIAQFWGKDCPLTGVRCHAEHNAKTAFFEVQMGMPAPSEIPAPGTQPSAPPGFAAQIRPLFRPLDIDRMIAVRNLDLRSYDVVASYAELILTRLEDGSMPYDGPWPASDIALFSAWIAGGKPR